VVIFNPLLHHPQRTAQSTNWYRKLSVPHSPCRLGEKEKIFYSTWNRTPVILPVAVPPTMVDTVCEVTVCTLQDMVNQW